MERKFQALFLYPHHLVPNANAFIISCLLLKVFHSLVGQAVIASQLCLEGREERQQLTAIGGPLKGKHFEMRPTT
jgi:hypothetical protein